MSIKTMFQKGISRFTNIFADKNIEIKEWKTITELEKYSTDFDKIRQDRNNAKINAAKFKNMLDTGSANMSKEDLKKKSQELLKIENVEKAQIKAFENLISRQIYDLNRIMVDIDILIKTEYKEVRVQIYRLLEEYNIVLQGFKETFKEKNTFIFPITYEQKDVIGKHFEKMHNEFQTLVNRICVLIENEEQVQLANKAEGNDIKLLQRISERQKLKRQINGHIVTIKWKFSLIINELKTIKNDKNARSFEVLKGIIIKMENQFDVLVKIFQERTVNAAEIVRESKVLWKTIILDIEELEKILNDFYEGMKLQNRAGITPEQNFILKKIGVWKEKNMGDLKRDATLYSTENDQEKEEARYTENAISEMAKSFDSKAGEIILDTEKLSTVPVKIGPTRSAVAVVLAGIIAIEAVSIPSSGNADNSHLLPTKMIVSATQADNDLTKTYIVGSENNKTQSHEFTVSKTATSGNFEPVLEYAPKFQEIQFKNSANNVMNSGISNLHLKDFNIEKTISTQLDSVLKANKFTMEKAEKDSMINQSLQALDNDSILTAITAGSFCTIDANSCVMGTSVNLKANMMLAYNRGMIVLDSIKSKMIQDATDPITLKVIDKVIQNAKLTASIVINSSDVQEVLRWMNKDENKCPSRFSETDKKLFEKGQEQMNNFTEKLRSLNSKEQVKSAIENSTLESIFSEDVIVQLNKFDSNLIYLRTTGNNAALWNKIKKKLDSDRYTKVNIKIVFNLPVKIKSVKTVDYPPFMPVVFPASNGITDINNPKIGWGNTANTKVRDYKHEQWLRARSGQGSMRNNYGANFGSGQIHR